MTTGRNTQTQLIQELASNRSFRAFIATLLDDAGVNNNVGPVQGAEMFMFGQGFKAFGQHIQSAFVAADMENYLLMLKENANDQ